MCGILAVFGKTESLDIDRCDQALMMMRQRGPDRLHSSVQMGGRLYLGQTVLSITGNGRKLPLQDWRYQILFNGEIYNHAALYSTFLSPRELSWESGTDTEVLAKLHIFLSPVEVYKKLSGMFTYVLHDREKKSLFVGRDMVGEKFLYCYEDERLLILSSEVRLILHLVPAIKMDRDVLREYFFTRHLLTAEQTVWKGISVIPPGQIREYDLVESRGWRPLHVRTLSSLIDQQRIENNRKRSEEGLVDELDALCGEVACSLCPSINYASVVSGGIDSSLASWFMAENDNKPALIALQFPGKDFPSSDESLGAFERAMNGRIEKYIVNEEDFRNHLESSYAVACSPLPTHSYVSQAILAEAVRDRGLRVLVVGEGGDEFFGGYDAYCAFYCLIGVSSTSPSPYSGFIPCGVEFKDWQPNVLRQRQYKQWQSALAVYEYERDCRDREIQAALLLDATIQLQSVGIRSADQMSMAYSVEARSFYLHESLMRFALNLPVKYKLNFAEHDEFTTKYLLKKLFARKFGAALIRPKTGFSGWPNEAGRILVGSDYRMMRAVLGPFTVIGINQQQWQAAEWKLANMEMFLRRFAHYA